MLKNNKTPVPGEVTLDGFQGPLARTGHFNRGYYRRQKGSEFNVGAAATFGHSRTNWTNERGSKNDVDRLPGSFLKHSSGIEITALADLGDGMQHRRQ